MSNMPRTRVYKHRFHLKTKHDIAKRAFSVALSKLESTSYYN